ncbi:MAG: hypothetical protein MJ113_03825 [Lachnospiraceae bacterium]|nr:hypothetical protein [Lachnospiraceae bacterium]
MKLKNLFLILAISVITLCFAGCTDEEIKTATDIASQFIPTATPTAAAKLTATPTPMPEDTKAPTKAPAQPTAAPTAIPEGMGITFEDGNAGFVMMNLAPVKADTEATCELADFNGSKAVKVMSGETSPASIQYCGFDLSSLVGDRIADVRTITFTVGAGLQNDTFYAVSGNLYCYVGENNSEVKNPWSVYLDTKNPKVATFTLPEDKAFVAGAKNIIVITKESDNGIEATGKGTDFYIDNLVFSDAAGNAIPVDTTVEFDAPEGFGEAQGGAYQWSDNAFVANQNMLANNCFQVTYDKLVGQNPFKYIVFQFAGDFTSQGWIGGGGNIGFDTANGWWQGDEGAFVIDQEAADNEFFYIVELPGDVVDTIKYEPKEDGTWGLFQLGLWWSSASEEATLLKVDLVDKITLSDWGKDALSPNHDFIAANCFQINYKDLIGNKPFKGLKFQIVGDFMSQGWIGGGGNVGFNYGSEWWQGDEGAFTITEESANTFVMTFPAEVCEQINYEAVNDKGEYGLLQIGYWWGSHTEEVTLTKVELIY